MPYKKLFSTRSKVKLKEVLHQLVDDSSINTVITYRQFKSGGVDDYDPEAQSISSSVWTSFVELNALKTYFTDFERMTATESEIEMGDCRFIINRRDIVNDPSPEDKIIETRDQSGVTYNIINYGADPLGIAYVFHCRRP